MHKWRLFWLLTLQLFYTSTFAQGEANIWYFGGNAGLDFNSGSPIALTDGQMYAPEGSAVMSDANGELLFYTNGVTVWNRNHDTLSNGAGLQGGLSSTQSSLIIPKPGSTSIFYIFTTSQTQQSGNWNFCYSEVDMTLDGGLGGITANKNVFLYTPIGEKITAVKHANNTDIWVITHAKFTNAYLTYSITSAGVNANPIIFNGGTVDNGTGEGYASPNWGYMKASPDGSKIAAAFFVVNRTDVLDFNKTTGQLSFRFTINQVVSPYGVEFSPNSSLLYVSSFSSPLIRQYNLGLATPSAIISSSFNIPLSNAISTVALQIGPDEKIYIIASANFQGNYIGAINNPDQIGLACNFNPNAVELGEGYAILGLPNFFPYFVIPSGMEHVGSCPNDSIFFAFLNGAQADSVLWNFDDSISGALNNSTSLTPFHIYQNPGTYIVSVTTFQGSVINTVTKPVTILPIPDISIGDDFTFCFGTTGAFYMANTQDGFTYNWFVDYEQFPFNNLQHPFTNLAVVNTGIYYATASNVCGVSSDTAIATGVYPITNFTLGPDVIFCEGDQVYLSPSSQGIGDYLWQDGNTEPYFFTSQSGTYSMQQSNSCGSVSDTILVTLLPLPVISPGADTLFCDGETIQLTPTGIFDDFTWSNGLLNEPLIINESGFYIAYASTVCGATYDTIIATKISAPLAFNFEDSLSFCQGSSLELDLTQANVSYLWQNGSTNPVFNVTETGTYSAFLSNQCGFATDTTFILANPLPTVSLGADTSICSGNPIQLNVMALADNYSWQDGTTNSSLIVNTTGMYSVMATNNCGSVSDTILVTLLALPVISLGTDTLFCEGETIQITPTGIFDDFVWQNGILNEPLVITETGFYIAYASTVCGATYDTIIATKISAPLAFNFEDSLSFCQGSSLELDLTQANVEYLWQDGSTNSQFSITQSGEYYVSVSNICGTTSDTVLAVVNPLPSVFLGDDISVCNDISVQLIANGIADTYLWSDGNTNSSITVTSPGIYSVTVTNSCGSKTDSIVVSTGSPTTGFININECEAVNINGIIYSTSGEFTQVLQNVIGCDSVLTINAEILDFNAQIFQTDSMLFVSGNPTTIQWINCSTGQVISGETANSFIPQNSGNYAAIINVGGCVDTSNCRYMLRSIKALKPSTVCDNIQISPNPTEDIISYTLDKPDYPIKLFTSAGSLLYSGIGNPQKQTLNLNDLSPAMYLLQVDECRFKIVKQ